METRVEHFFKFSMYIARYIFEQVSRSLLARTDMESLEVGIHAEESEERVHLVRLTFIHGSGEVLNKHTAIMTKFAILVLSN